MGATGSAAAAGNASCGARFLELHVHQLRNERWRNSFYGANILRNGHGHFIKASQHLIGYRLRIEVLEHRQTVQQRICIDTGQFAPTSQLRGQSGGPADAFSAAANSRQDTRFQLDLGTPDKAPRWLRDRRAGDAPR
jgi:hypothetical protein